MKIIIDGVIIETSSIQEATQLIKSLKEKKLENKLITSKKKKTRKGGIGNTWNKEELQFLFNNLDQPLSALKKMIPMHSEMSIYSYRNNFLKLNKLTQLMKTIVEMN
jgi:hypothetical protein